MIHYRLTQHARCVIAERGINLTWIEGVLEHPLRTERDRTDHELRHALGRIPDYGDRVLRVIYNDATTPWLIVTAYFDRSMRDTL